MCGKEIIGEPDLVFLEGEKEPLVVGWRCSEKEEINGKRVRCVVDYLSGYKGLYTTLP